MLQPAVFNLVSRSRAGALFVWGHPKATTKSLHALRSGADFTLSKASYILDLRTSICYYTSIFLSTNTRLLSFNKQSPLARGPGALALLPARERVRDFVIPSKRILFFHLVNADLDEQNA